MYFTRVETHKLDYGQWVPVYGIAASKWKAFVRCPGCGMIRCLSQYSVLDTGEIQPPLKCDTINCNFKEVSYLTGWDFGNLPR